MDEDLEAVILGDGNDDDIELIILHHIFINRNNVPRRPHFNLENVTDEYAKLNFRFSKPDITRLARALRLPNEIIIETRNRVNGVTSLCILLKRLSYPNRLSDLSYIFGLSPQSLSQIINLTINIILANHEDLLTNLEVHNWLNRAKMEKYSDVIRNKGGAVPNCWGFIDGTARQMCRPSIDQENYYSGHKRFHCLKYQSVLCPDGMILSLKGGFQGRRHDARIFRESQLYQELERKAVFPNNEKYVLYGDQAYGISELLLCPYPGRPEDLAPHRRQFNASMKTLRVAVEWGFQKVVSEFAFVDFRKNQKLLLQDFQSMYKVAVLLCNCHSTLYGNQYYETSNVYVHVIYLFCMFYLNI